MNRIRPNWDKQEPFTAKPERFLLYFRRIRIAMLYHFRILCVLTLLLTARSLSAQQPVYLDLLFGRTMHLFETQNSDDNLAPVLGFRQFNGYGGVRMQIAQPGLYLHLGLSPHKVDLPFRIKHFRHPVSVTLARSTNFALGLSRRQKVLGEHLFLSPYGGLQIGWVGSQADGTVIPVINYDEPGFELVFFPEASGSWFKVYLAAGVTLEYELPFGFVVAGQLRYNHGLGRAFRARVSYCINRGAPTINDITAQGHFVQLQAGLSWQVSRLWRLK